MDDFSSFSLRPLSSGQAPAPRPPRPASSGGFRTRAETVIGTCIVWWREGLRRYGWKGMLIRGVFGMVGLVVLYIAFLWVTLPDISDPRKLVIPYESTVITDRNGIELYRIFAEEDRTYVDASAIPQEMKDAIIAIEDERFYQEGSWLRFGCVDIRGIARAAYVNIFGGSISQGASTITQQLARNALLTQERRISRKIQEIMLACTLERHYTKDKLLELYLNWIPFGQNAYGIEQASRTFFGISAKDLTLAQSAILASLPQRPSYFRPFGRHRTTAVSPDIAEGVLNGTIRSAADISENDVTIGLLGTIIGTGSTTVYVGGRADQVLWNMQQQEFIKETERLQALQELSTITFQSVREDIRAPHFVLWIRDQVEELFKTTAEKGLLERGGLTITTTLDWRLQQAAEEAVAAHRDDVRQRFNAHNIALVALDPHTQEILAYVGNSDYGDDDRDAKVDMVQAARQPGSSFKPFIYAAAFEKGYGPATVLYDAPTKFAEDEPQNFDGRFWGPMTIRRALAASRNIPAIKAYFLAGGDEDKILSLVARFGASTPQREKEEIRKTRPDFAYGYPLAIGTAETPLLEMAHAYSIFPALGKQRPVVSITSITVHSGALIMGGAAAPEPEEVLDPRIAYEITSILSDAQARPNQYWQEILSVPGTESAAKTGTSNKCLEKKEETGQCITRRPESLWTIGYTPSLLAGVWIGNANSESLYERAEALSTASPIWKDFMTKAQRLLPNASTHFPEPSGLVHPQISTLSGQLPTACTPVAARAADVFLSENAPTLPDPACAPLIVDKVTGLLASESCPAEARESGSFLVAKEVMPDRWPLWDKGAQEWVTKQMELWRATPDHSGSLLLLPVAPTEICDPALTPGRLIKPEITIVSPSPNGTASFPSFRPEIHVTVGSSVREIQFRIDSRFITKTGSGVLRAPLLVLPRSIDRAQPHTLTVTLIDRYYNRAEASVSFTLAEDKGMPSIRFLDPAPGATFSPGTNLTAHVEATDPEGGLKFVEFFLDGKLLTTKPQEPYELKFPLIKMAAGPHTLSAKATDLAGNVAEDEVQIEVR